MKGLTLVLGLVGLAYILNLGFGVIEFIPDNAPIIGNVDEAVATLLIVPLLKELKLMG